MMVKGFLAIKLLFYAIKKYNNGNMNAKIAFNNLAFYSSCNVFLYTTPPSICTI